MNDTVKNQNSRIKYALLFFAGVVVILRVLAPFEIQKDQAQQLEAALNLVDGKGLTISSVQAHSFDIIQPIKPVVLTWFPPTFSLLVAACLGLGFPLVIALKIIYAIATLLGWYGWGFFAEKTMRSDFLLGKKCPMPPYVFIIPFLPLFFTPSWGGTDLFLWAGVPFVVQLLTARKDLSTLLAGLLCGILYSVRYSSLFLILAGILVIMQMEYTRLQSFLKSSFRFGAGSMVVILAVSVYNQLALGTIGPSYIGAKLTSPSLYSTINRIFTALIALSNMLIASPVIQQIFEDRVGLQMISTLLGGVFFLIILWVPARLFWSSFHEKKETGIEKNILLTLSLLPLSMMVFLVFTEFLTSYGTLSTRRYYEPVLLVYFFIFYKLISEKNSPHFLKIIATGCVCAFLINLFIYLPAQFLQESKRGKIVNMVLSYTPSRSLLPSVSIPIVYPSSKIFSRKENSRMELSKLHEKYPDALFFALGSYQLYVYDRFQKGGPPPGVHFKTFGERDYWGKAFSSKAAKVFWVLDYPSEVEQVKQFDFIPKENLKEFFFDPFEKTKILMSDIPANYKFIKFEK